jgi:hypothetical protein
MRWKSGAQGRGVSVPSGFEACPGSCRRRRNTKGIDGLGDCWGSVGIGIEVAVQRGISWVFGSAGAVLGCPISLVVDDSFSPPWKREQAPVAGEGGVFPTRWVEFFPSAELFFRKDPGGFARDPPNPKKPY